jgi:hypothetical protein
MRLRRKSKKRRAAELLGTYLKLRAVQKTAKGAGKAAKGTAAFKVARKTPVVRTLPAVAVAAGAAVFAGRRLRSGSEHQPQPAAV